MDNALIAAILLMAVLTYPVYQWAESRYNEKTGITTFRQDCKDQGGTPITIAIANTCIMP